MVPRLPFIVVLLATAAVSIVRGQPAPVQDVPTVLVSRQLLESQNLAVGDLVTLSSDPSGAAARQFRIAGEYEPTPDPMRLGLPRHEVRMHLPDIIGITASTTDPLDRESVDAINVGLGPNADAAAVERDLSTRLPGVLVQSTSGDSGRAAPFVVLERFHLAIAIVTVIASSIFLLALMLMLVDERRATVGILRLIGFGRRRILMHVLAEGLVIAVAGAMFGILLSVGLEDLINRFFQWRYDSALVFVHITPAISLQSVLISVPLGVLATLASSSTLLRGDVLSLTRR
jgi:predicted lysophospholipase L1 biosynthesis ABC-type transport system permease subunit